MSGGGGGGGAGGWFGGSKFSQLGRAAKDMCTGLEKGVQNVAENLEGALITFGEGQAERAGCVTRTSSFDSLPPNSPGHNPSPPTPGPGDEGSERERLCQGQAGSGPMGCGSSYDYRSPAEPSDAQAAGDSVVMLCDMCSSKFSLITRKKCCCECSNFFCSSCLPREQGVRTRTCSRCRVLHKMPPHRGDLMKLRVKDLQHFLSKRRINIKACVEKKDLVELVLQHSGVAGEASGVESSGPPPSSRLAASRSGEDPGIRVSDQVPLERSSNFPQNYTDSSHRRDWFQEKFGPNSDSGTPSDAEGGEVSMGEATPVESFSHPKEPVEAAGELAGEEAREEVTQVEEMVSSWTGGQVESMEGSDTPEEDAAMEDADEIISVTVVSEDTGDLAEGAVGVSDEAASEPVEAARDAKVELAPSEAMGEEATAAKEEAEDGEPIEEMSEEGAVGGLRLDQSAPSCGVRLGLAGHLLGDQETGSTPSSPRRFANQGMVYLSEIQSIEDLRELSTKQVKELLAMNRVNFKGCVEKEELLKIVERLWRQEQRNREEGDTMDDDSMCKICMDSPIDCVMLECGHMCTCTNCGKQMAECPICRQYVVRVVKTFKA